MKKEDFTKEIRESVERKKKELDEIREQIKGLEAEITDLQARIDSYTDISDVKTYSNMKDNVEIRQHKLEVLKHSLEEKTNYREDDPEISRQAAIFRDEKKRIDEAYAEEMEGLIEKLDAVCKEGCNERGRLKDLCEQWVKVNGLPMSYYMTVDTLDKTGITGNVQNFMGSIDTLRTFRNISN